MSRGITWINSGGNNGDGQYYRHQVRLAGDRVAFGPSGDNTFLASGAASPWVDALGERLGIVAGDRTDYDLFVWDSPDG